MKSYTFGITNVRHIMLGGKLLSFKELVSKYSNVCDFLKYAEILSAIPKLPRTNLKNILDYELTNKPYHMLSFHKNIVRNLYDLIPPKHCLLLMHKQEEWEIE